MSAQFAEAASGAFVRQPNHFADRITADGSSDYPVEAGRYVLYVCLACPWAHRSVIVRALLGLEDVIALRLVDPIRDEKGWRFTLDEGGVDPGTGASYVMELYQRSDPDFEGRATVPFLWDTRTERIVSNDYPQITLDLSTQWTAHHKAGAPNLYPERSRAAIDDMAAQNFTAVNNGVYKAGFATSQEAYEQAYDALFAHLWPYARDLFQTPGFGDTTDFDHVKRHYYGTHDKINPTGVVPKGPDLAGWQEPHGRDHLGDA